MKRTLIQSFAAFVLALGLGVSAAAPQASAQESRQKAPDEYYQVLGRANYAFQHAKNKDDYAAASKLFQKAVDLAPWLPDTYYNLGQAQKSAEQFNDAIGSLQHYLELKPDASDRDKVKETIEMLKGEAQQATEQPPPQEKAPETQEQKDADFIRSLDGAEYRTSERDIFNCLYRMRIEGNSLSLERDCHGRDGREHIYHQGSVPIAGREAIRNMQAFQGQDCPPGSALRRIIYGIFDDRIVEHRVAENGDQAMWDAGNVPGGGRGCIPQPAYTYYRIR